MRRDRCIVEPRCRQTGAATLIMVLAVLVLLTILTIMGGRIATSEQRTAANELRARQSLEAAMTGIDRALTVNGPLNAAPDQTPRAAAPGGGTYSVEFCDSTIRTDGTLTNRLPVPTERCTAPPADATVRLIYARGWSDDETGLHHIVALAERAPAFAGTPRNPLTARGNAIINGSGDVTNPYGRFTIWTGRQSSFTNANFKTNILAPTGLGVVESSSNRQVGLDVVDSDSNLGSVDGPTFFKNFMGFTPQVYAAAVGAQIITDGDLGARAGSASYNKILWFTDPAATPSSPAEFSEQGNPVFGYLGDAENPPAPAVVVIDGDLAVTGGVTVNGLLYVRGNITGHGNLTIRGAVIVEGDVSNLTGSVDIIYEPLVLGAAQGLGRIAILPGSWKDWLQADDV